MKHLIVTVALLLTGCPVVCAHLDTRCFDSNPQTCNADGRWEMLFPCEEGHTCEIDYEGDPACVEEEQ